VALARGFHARHAVRRARVALAAVAAHGAHRRRRPEGAWRRCNARALCACVCATCHTRHTLRQP
jgi:hypothetical protein